MSAAFDLTTAHPFDTGGNFAVEARASWQLHTSQPLDPEGFQALQELADGDLEFLADLVTTYCDQATALLSEARTAGRAGVSAGIVRAVHALNGSSRNIGAYPLARLCTAIEKDAQINPDSAWLAMMVDLLEEPLNAVLLALEEHLPATQAVMIDVVVPGAPAFFLAR